MRLLVETCHMGARYRVPSVSTFDELCSSQ
jgi:hypothetical protein